MKTFEDIFLTLLVMAAMLYVGYRLALNEFNKPTPMRSESVAMSRMK